MKDNNFDTQLKSALENLEAPYDAASWTLLEQRLNTLETGPVAVTEEVAPFDQAMSQKLESIEAPYQPAHWDMLSKRMDNSKRFTRRIWISKLAEAAIFLLLLVNINFYLHQTGPFTPQAPTRLKPGQPVAKAPGKRAHPSTNGQMLVGNLPVVWQSEGSGVLLFPDISGTDALFAPDLPADTKSPDQFSVVLNSNNGVAANDGLSQIATAGFLPLLVPGTVSTGRRVQVAGIPVTPFKQHGAWYAASFAGLDLNRVNESGELRPANSYSGGFAAGFRKGNWGVEAGLGYTSKNYQPKKQYIVAAGTPAGGYWATSLAEVDADMLHIPVKVTRNIVKKGKNSIHGVAGASANIALQKTNRYQTIFYPPSGQTGVQPQQPPIDAQYQPEGRGLLENGALTGNTYTTLDAGLRFEHRITPTASLYVEPLYRYAIGNKGIGQQPARMNAFSFQAGVMASL